MITTTTATQWVVYFPSEGYFSNFKKSRKDNGPRFTGKLENAKIYKKKAYAMSSMRMYGLESYERGPRYVEVTAIVDEKELFMEEFT